MSLKAIMFAVVGSGEGSATGRALARRVVTGAVEPPADHVDIRRDDAGVDGDGFGAAETISSGVSGLTVSRLRDRPLEEVGGVGEAGGVEDDGDAGVADLAW